MKTEDAFHSNQLKPTSKVATVHKVLGFNALIAACIGFSATVLMDGVSAADESALPPVQHAGAISYRNGGIGSDESAAMKAEAAAYPLVLTFADRIDNRDSYASDVQVTIVRADGTPMLETGAAGPLLLIDLPAGMYRVTATSGDHSKTQPVKIAAGTHKKLVFEWVGAAAAE